jgi:hypothetical protein
LILEAVMDGDDDYFDDEEFLEDEAELYVSFCN